MKTVDYYDLGYDTAIAASRSRGGSRGLQFYADALKLTGEARAEFIQGYEDAMEDMATSGQEEES